MKIWADIEQGSAAWHAVRLGVPTASRMSEVITPAKGELAAGRKKYAYQLIAERVLQEPMATDIGSLQWIIEGKEREAEAAAMYAEIAGVELLTVGFISDDDHRWGCSPDRLIVADGKRAAAEIKAPKENTQIGYLLDGPGSDYRVQLQTQIWIGDLTWDDFFSYNPRLPPFMQRTNPDEAFIKKIETHVRTFADELDDMERRVRAMGYFSPAPKIASDDDRRADALIADPAKMAELKHAIDYDRVDVLDLALGTLPREQQERVKHAIATQKDVFG